MYCLVQTKHKKYLVAANKNITRNDNGLVTYRGYEYETSLILRNGRKKDLLKIAQDLADELPKVYIEKVNERKILRLERTEVSNKTLKNESVALEEKITDIRAVENESNELDLSSLSKKFDCLVPNQEPEPYDDTRFNTVDSILRCSDGKTNLQVPATKLTTEVKNINDCPGKTYQYRVNEDEDHTNTYGIKNPEQMNNVSPDHQSQDKSVNLSTKVSKPVIKSNFVGHFLPTVNGHIQKVPEPMKLLELDDVPIIISNDPVNNTDGEEISFYPLIGDNIAFPVVLAENNGSYIDNTEIKIDSDLYSKVQNAIVSSEINRGAETLLLDPSLVDSSRTHPIRSSDEIDDDKDPNYVPDSIQDSDYDSDSSDSHISELDELNDLEESDNLETDDILRETINNSENSTLVSELTLSDLLRSSIFEIDQSKDDSTFIPDIESSLNESIDINSVVEKSTANSIEKLLSTAVAPVLHELDVVPSRHYRDAHANEPEVKYFLALEKIKNNDGANSPNANELTRKILAINNDDEISEIIRYDPLLIVFTNDLTERYTNQHHHNMIRSRLRMLGSILLKVMEFNEDVFKNGRINQHHNPVDVKGFADILDPRLYDNMIIAVQVIVGVNIETSECRAPSTATTAGTWITKVAKVYKKELIKN
ncbi:hypothetical protein KQX54_006442 [Cotesia glomerata]|uniref:Uncharacterized protein n=1 Tax=Cotesia glomerata TaxID=32391 RepID=A0AAV7IZK5_COTGL|nr:hypothetical protein KQX54_006442 [Cotesia glomerata]